MEAGDPHRQLEVLTAENRSLDAQILALQLRKIDVQHQIVEVETLLDPVQPRQVMDWDGSFEWDPDVQRALERLGIASLRGNQVVI